MSKKEKKPTSNAFPEPVNNQINQNIPEKLGDVYAGIAEATGILFENSVDSQQQQNVLAQAATIQGIMQIYEVDTISDAISIARMLDDDKVETKPNHHKNKGKK